MPANKLAGAVTMIRSSVSCCHADKLDTDTVYMYLSGVQPPDFRTLCRFRSMHLEGVEQAFKQIVQFSENPCTRNG